MKRRLSFRPPYALLAINTVRQASKSS